jgi:hypothetical protein
VALFGAKDLNFLPTVFKIGGIDSIKQKNRVREEGFLPVVENYSFPELKPVS